MGCDGGTIPKRDELVKTKKKPEQKDKTAELAFRWKHCAVSQEPLQPPIVACELGRIYNKETILEALVDKSSTYASSDIISHIKTLRDVKELKLTENSSWSESDSIEKGGVYIDVQKSKYVCPVVGQEMNGRFRFVFVWTCGCVLSEKAIKEMGKSKKQTTTEDKATYECLKCQKPFLIDNIILLNPIEESEIEILSKKMEVRRLKVKEEKKSKKKNGPTPSATVTSDSSSIPAEESEKSGEKTIKEPKDKKDLDLKSKMRKGAELKPGTSSGPSAAKLTKLEDASAKIVGNYSVAKDPKASDTYKSLFTSSEKAQNQNRAHWVTYNPFYN